MEKSTLYKNKLRFIDGSSNVADIEYVNDSINFNKTVSFGGGVQANSLTVSSGSSLVVSALSALNLKGSTTGTLTVEANANTTDHTLIMPATQGSASTVLTNDGSGNLSWTAAGGGGSSSNIVNGVGTDNAIVRFDTNGNTLQNSNVFITDTGHITGINGTVTNPSYSFTGNVTSGMYSGGDLSNIIHFATGGIQRVSINNTG